MNFTKAPPEPLITGVISELVSPDDERPGVRARHGVWFFDNNDRAIQAADGVRANKADMRHLTPNFLGTLLVMPLADRF